MKLSRNFAGYFSRVTLRKLNLIILGLFVGYLMACVLNLFLDAVVKTAWHPLEEEKLHLLKTLLTLFAFFIGLVTTIRSSEELYLCIPFVRFYPKNQNNKDIVLDLSSLGDPRLIDLASFGLLDNRLILPRFILKELHAVSESEDEQERGKAKRSLDALAKVESLPHLNLRYQETDFPEIDDTNDKISRLARLLDADILTADVNRLQNTSGDGIRYFNIHSLANALKPIMQKGEYLKVKIQRFGKEEMQGIGYLEDGTMVVVNGGGSFIGETIKTRVLSVKSTTSGRMIFCNAEGEVL